MTSQLSIISIITAFSAKITTLFCRALNNGFCSIITLVCVSNDIDHLKLVFRSYISNRYQGCKISNSFSQCKRVLADVPQGSILGPLLFNIFNNDIFLLLQSASLQITLMIVLFTHLTKIWIILWPHWILILVFYQTSFINTL